MPRYFGYRGYYVVKLINLPIQRHMLATASRTTMTENLLVVKNAVREFVPDDYQVSSDFYEALSEDVEDTIQQAAERSEGNNRKTLQPRDL